LVPALVAALSAMGYGGADGIRKKFTGYERDAETGLDYAQARYFSSAQGRFTSADPLTASGEPTDPQTWNRYAYVSNNPLVYADPSGLSRQPGGRNISNWNGAMATEQATDGISPWPDVSTQAPQQPTATGSLGSSAAQSTASTQATEPQTPTSVTAQVPPANTLVNILFNGSYFNGVGSIIRFTIMDQNGKPIPNVSVLESVTPQTTIQNPNFVTFPDGVVTDLVGRGTYTPQPFTLQQAGNVIVPILATPTPPVVQGHMMIIQAPSGASAIATDQRSYTNLDAQGNHRPFVNPQTGRSINNFSITVSPVTVVRMPVVMCPRF
jgi:RHS repeat-associated protein